MESNLIEKIAYIKNKESIFYKEWGVIKYFDGDYYHIAIANDNKVANIFDRKEFTIRRNKK